MDIREATQDDAAAIRSVARFSMEASYSLSPATIESAVRQWYDDEAFAERREDEDVLLLVGETEDGIVAFSESHLVDGYGDVHWLHVNPMYRGEGIGERLFEATRSALEERGASVIRGLVLDDNPEGNAFYEDRGLHPAGEGAVEIDGTEHIENVYTSAPPEEGTTIAGDGRELYLDRSDPERGSKGPFYTVYSDEERTTKYGFYCDNCDTLVTSMDSMGRMECEACGNVRKPRRWDAAHM